MSGSLALVGFSLLIVLVFHLRRSAGWRRAVLTVANLGFLASFATSDVSLLPLGAFLLATYAGLRWIRASPRIAFLPVIALTLTAFFCMKRYTFVPPILTLPSAFATIGLSYILFRVLHLFIDTHSGALKAPVSALSYFNYTANFATLASGPIQLYPDFDAALRLAYASRLSLATALPALERIVRGVFKTNVLALLLSAFHTRVMDSLTAPQPWDTKLLPAVLTIVIYPLFLFCNFSGYIDIVIGVGELLGLPFPENFNRPFSAESFLDFWTYRWHITLSSWLKTYVYNPLLIALMRAFPSGKLDLVLGVFAYFVTFFLVGLWHGQTPEFLFYGFLLGFGVSANKAFQLAMAAWIGRKRYAAVSANPLYLGFARGLTFTYYAVTLMWFWATWRQLAQLLSAAGTGAVAAAVCVVFLGSTLILAITAGLRPRAAAPDDPILKLGWRVAWTTTLAVTIVVITVFAHQAAPEIVYKAF